MKESTNVFGNKGKRQLDGNYNVFREDTFICRIRTSKGKLTLFIPDDNIWLG